jgi:Ca2+-binding EF-hand superfamily protein
MMKWSTKQKRSDQPNRSNMKAIKVYVFGLAAACAAGAILSVTAHDLGREPSFDLNDDGNITKEEFATASVAMVKELQADFLARYDSVPQGQKTGDGIITPAESVGVHQAQAEAWLKDLLAHFDTNKDGAISTTEAARARGHGGPAHLKGLDTNNDGNISSAELVSAAIQMAADHQARFVKKFDSIPQGATAGDATITAAESLAVHQEHVMEKVAAILDRFDLNDDGSVTSQEIGEVHGKRKDGPRDQRGPGRR